MQYILLIRAAKSRQLSTLPLLTYVGVRLTQAYAAYLRSSVSTVSFLDRMERRMRALELPLPAEALRCVDPVPRNLSFLIHAQVYRSYPRNQEK